VLIGNLYLLYDNLWRMYGKIINSAEYFVIAFTLLRE
jgi:hypothetical protein